MESTIDLSTYGGERLGHTLTALSTQEQQELVEEAEQRGEVLGDRGETTVSVGPREFIKNGYANINSVIASTEPT